MTQKIATFKRIAFLAFFHYKVFCVAVLLAYLIRFDFSWTKECYAAGFNAFLLIGPLKCLVFGLAGHYSGWWFYVTIKDLLKLIQTAIGCSLLIFALAHFKIIESLPRSIPVIDFFLTIFILGGIRASWRMVREEFLPLLKGVHRRRVLFIGSDLITGRFAHQLHSDPDLDYRVIGFLSTNPEVTRKRLGHIPVLGSMDKLNSLVNYHYVNDVFILAGMLPGNQLREVMEICAKLQVELKVIPQAECRLGNQSIPIRKINIEDLLQRDSVKLDDAVIRSLIAGRRVMVTGAGGSIGSEICRNLIQYGPAELIMLGRGENRIFFIEAELSGCSTDTQLTPVIADVTNSARISQVFSKYRPEIIFHAAAHKHVPLMESNVSEAVRNNVMGTRNMVDLADKFGSETFVLISTDKAVRPTSVMGMTKHMAERYVMSKSVDSKTKFMVTRFGNVLGSVGSVVPIFEKQIREGGPITVTDPEMTRYFMTIPEAAGLVLQAAGMGTGGEIFVLDMGSPVRIVDMARDMIRLAGLPEKSIEITFSGLRPGEKLFEELYYEGEEMQSTGHRKLMMAKHEEFSPAEVLHQVVTLESILDGPDAALREKLEAFLPTYRKAVMKKAG